MIKTKFAVLFCMLMPLFFSCKVQDQQAPKGAIQIDDKFDVSAVSWKGDFADYPVGAETFYELNYSHANLPAPLNQSAKGIRISGNNHSDDLFMFLKKKVSGLAPNQHYNVKIEIELASNASSGSFGVGGSPGESVTIKSGFTTIEPMKIIDQASNHYILNVDKSNQANSGTDLKVLGNVANGTEKNEYLLIRRSGEFTGKADASGNAWIIIGTDSGFEATTTLYYTEVKASITPAG